MALKRYCKTLMNKFPVVMAVLAISLFLFLTLWFARNALAYMYLSGYYDGCTSEAYEFADLSVPDKFELDDKQRDHCLSVVLEKWNDL